MVDITFKSDRRFTSPREGVEFSFEYKQPDKTEVDAMRQQLEQSLRHVPKLVDDVVDAHHLRRLLDQPKVASDAEVDALLSGLDQRDDSNAARRVIVAYLAEHHADDHAVIDRYVRALNARRNAAWLRELAFGEAASLTDKRLIPPVLAILRKPSVQWQSDVALRVLARHRHLADDPEALTAELGRTVSIRRPSLTGDPDADSIQWAYWKQSVENIVIAGDPTTAETLVPYLSVDTGLYSIKDISLAPRGPSNELPIRVRDIAANAILDLTGDDETPRATMYADVDDEAAEMARRDAVADRLRERLSDDTSVTLE